MGKCVFTSARDVETISILDVVDWTHGRNGSRLHLPTIQRSAVWRNSQIINYWDSLLRGYPAGLMLVHRSRPESRTFEGTTTRTGINDFDLFDGQQRLTALLLGYGAGQLSSRLRLWVDLGVMPNPESGLLFQLRVSSSGQPFGYRATDPNDKPPLGERAKSQTAWQQKHGIASFKSEQAFRAAEGEDLIDSKFAVPLADAVKLVINHEHDAIKALHGICPQAKSDLIDMFVRALSGALRRPIIFQLVDSTLLNDEKEYVRYFTRIGQGGTRLSNDELTYSIIKLQYPQVSDRMREIMTGAAGRIASEVDLVLAALRVAKITSRWDGNGLEWKIVGRPYPDFVSELKQESLTAIRNEFLTMMAPAPLGLLGTGLRKIRERLEYHPKNKPTGLPCMLLARIPHALVDVLLLRQCCEESSDSKTPVDLLPSFVLFWLLFVEDSDKAAWLVFRLHLNQTSSASLPTLPTLVQTLISEGLAHAVPHQNELILLRQEVDQGNHRLRAWDERFTGCDIIDKRCPGTALRKITCEHDRERSKCLLMWVQRGYLTDKFSDFDPTSNRDEDLPVDLDHLVPDSKFGFHWKSRDRYLDFADEDENFKHHRCLVGNSLGNYRWLGASENRGRGNRDLEPLPNHADRIAAPEDWNRLIKKPRWTLADVEDFQRRIDLRSLDLVTELLNDPQFSTLTGAPSPNRLH